MTKIKVCGLTRDEDIVFANLLAPDFIGFVFVRTSKRYVAPECAMRLRSLLSKTIVPVGVFKNESDDSIIDICKSGIIDAIQLHGDEDDHRISSLRKRVGVPIIKAYCVRTPDDVRKAERSAADLVMLDGGAGGTGEVFDWKMTVEIRRPFFLAGGLDPENVSGAISVSHPFAVDVSSGVEKRGSKDFGRIKDFIEAVRGKRE